MKIIFFIFFILLYKAFYLTPWGVVEGTFNVRDISLFLLAISLLFSYFGKTRVSNSKKDGFSLLIIVYMFIVLISIVLATINYNQSIINGVVAARSQYFYLVYFVFIALIKRNEDIYKILNALLYIAMVVFFLTLVNYFVTPVFYHEKAEGWGAVRSGIERAFVPGTPLISFAAVWASVRWVTKEKSKSDYSGIMAVFLIGAHFFQQSRGGIISLMAVLCLLFWLTQNYRKLVAMLAMGFLGVLLSGFFMEENILLAPFTTTVEDVSEQSGTVGARMSQVETDLYEFKQHPIIGSGLIAVRTATYGSTTYQREVMAAKARVADLGYMHWIKIYGIVGIIWLLFLYWAIKRTIGKAFKIKDKEAKVLVLFCTGYMLFIVISSITLNHFLIDERIVLFCLILAILRLVTLKKVAQEKTNKEMN